MHSFILKLIGVTFGYNELNDGMVGVSSCVPASYYTGGTTFSTSDATNPMYLPDLTHEDIRGSNGNGWTGSTKPLTWYSTMIKRGTKDAAGRPTCPIVGQCAHP